MNKKILLKALQFSIFSLAICNENQITILPFMDSTTALHFIKKYLPEDPVIIEAGAYDGTETLQMSQMWPKSKIHAFEPVPRIYQWLTQKTKDCKNVYRYFYALSNKTGFSRFYLSEDPNNPDIPTTSGSLLPAKEHKNLHHYIFKNNTLVKTITLNDWAKKNKIEKVDLLWLDMQGFELPALKEGLDVLKKVKVIYTEAEFVEAYEGQPLYNEVLNWLTKQGFTLIAQDAIKPTKKHWCCNCVFVKSRNIKI